MSTFTTRASWMAAAGIVAVGLGTFLVVRPGDRAADPALTRPALPPLSIAEPRIEAELTPFSTAPRESKVFGANEVDARALIINRDRTPVYPDSLRNKRQEGAVLARFVVGQNGRVDLSSFEAERSSDALFTDAVKAYLAQARFDPAIVRGRHVAQLVRMPFTFTLTGVGSSVSYGVASNVVNLDDGIVSFDGADWIMSNGEFMEFKLEAAEFRAARLKPDYLIELSDFTNGVRYDAVTGGVIIESKPATKIRSLKDTLLRQYEYEIERRK